MSEKSDIISIIIIRTLRTVYECLWYGLSWKWIKDTTGYLYCFNCFKFKQKQARIVEVFGSPQQLIMRWFMTKYYIGNVNDQIGPSVFLCSS